MQLLMHEDLHEYYHFKVLPILKNEKNMCMWYECKPTETIKCIPMYRYDTVSKYANKNKDKN